MTSTTTITTLTWGHDVTLYWDGLKPREIFLRLAGFPAIQRQSRTHPRPRSHTSTASVPKG